MLLLLACAPPATDGRPPGDRGEDTAGETGADHDTTPDSGVAGDGRTCGEERVGGREECDGGDDDACPGACSSHCACPSAAPTGELELVVLDVGQGDAELVVSPAGFTLLVDAGDRDQYPAVRDYLATRGLPALDYTLVSHQHADHMGAMDEVLLAHPEVSVAFDAGTVYDSVSYEEYLAAAGDRRQTVLPGDLLDLGPGVQVEVLHADADDPENENNNSVVVRVRYGAMNLLLGGDCEFSGCERALETGPIEVYKVHHHGSGDASSPGLLEEMAPRTAIIPVGADNSYGHPSEDTLARLEAVGATTWRTDLHGDVVVRCSTEACLTEGTRAEE